MERITDWKVLWRELVERTSTSARTASAKGRPPDGWSDADDPWAARASEFRERVQRRQIRPDRIRDYLLETLASDSTIIDIGAGTGNWATRFARKGLRVTAIEPSPAMRLGFEQSVADELSAEERRRVHLLSGFWPDVSVEKADYAFCAHSLYGDPDLLGFVRQMIAHARRGIFLLMRFPIEGSLMGEAMRLVWGQPFDSPNGIVGLNLLFEAGIFPNLLIERNPWRPWTSANFEDALASLKGRLWLGESAEYDARLLALLEENLKPDPNGSGLVWPEGIISGLLYLDLEGDSVSILNRPHPKKI